jgi:hypothetical protein
MLPSRAIVSRAPKFVKFSGFLPKPRDTLYVLMETLVVQPICLGNHRQYHPVFEVFSTTYP